MLTQKVSGITAQGAGDTVINVSDLSYELENVLGFFNNLNGEDAISNLTFLIEEYSKPGYVSVSWNGQQ